MKKRKDSKKKNRSFESVLKIRKDLDLNYECIIFTYIKQLDKLNALRNL